MNAAYSKVSTDGLAENNNKNKNDNDNDNDNDIELTGLPYFDETEISDDAFQDDQNDDYDENDDDDDDEDEDEEEEDDDDNDDGPYTKHNRIPLEMIEEQLLWNVFNRWEEPQLLSLVVTTLFLIPTLILWMYGIFEFVGKIWSIWILVLHLQFRLSISVWYIKSTYSTTVPYVHRRSLRIICSIMTILEVILCGIVYPAIGYILTETFFRDIDETIIIDWTKEVRYIRIGIVMGWLVVFSRCFVGITCLAIRTVKRMSPDSYREWRPTYWTPYNNGVEEGSLDERTRHRLYSTFRFLNILVFGVNLICILSLLSHFGPWPPKLSLIPENCDSMDDTECALPFPSFHHMKVDTTSRTGWRVNLKGMPLLRGGIPLRPRFLDELDGFSTMGAILFYMEGLKESHENNRDTRKELQGPERIAYSVTPQSITLLVDVNEQMLIHHSAEVDYLDPKHPTIMVFPAEPLKHKTHYAVAVISAKDEFGHNLPRTKGMLKMMKETNSKTRTRLFQKVIPAIQRAAPWFSFKKDPESLQLLFDFVTVSEESQLGPVRAARDIALEHVEKWNWREHVHVVSVENNDCDGDDPPPIGRIIHLSLDVPSFLHHESRYSFLDPNKIQREKYVTTGQAKAIVYIPCSLKKETLKESSGNKLRSILEYGHGLMGSRAEIFDDFLQKMGDRNGYIMMAMDWRGMSLFDLPVVIRTLIGSPDLSQAMRDNLIQGFANKLCLQHFSQNGMLDLEEFKFNNKPIPTLTGHPPSSVFYGISQGGILGAGYISLAGKLIDRAILGAPGTPFALVLSRSHDFSDYDKLLLMNFYNNRHVRIMLSLFQMAWDSTEASGLQAKPVSESFPPLLLQAGLGDPEVPSIAAEYLARAMGASTLPGNPRQIFGVPVEPAATNETWLGPRVTISELLFEKEYSNLPIDNESTDFDSNHVHWCVRVDDAMIKQIEEFINNERIIDPCTNDQCQRISSAC